jgi:hypothetical protein
MKLTLRYAVQSVRGTAVIATLATAQDVMPNNTGGNPAPFRRITTLNYGKV